MILNIAVAPGEVLDKITILEIKRARIEDDAKRANVEREYRLLADAMRAVAPSAELDALKGELKAVNETLWQIEDDIREQERRKDFGADFVRLARAVYLTNDRRANLKRRINELLKSSLVEEKAYAAY